MAKPISEDKRNMILNGNLFRAILMLAIPVMINSFIQSMYNLTDTFWLGKIGTENQSAITLVSPFQNILINFGNGITTAGAILISQYLGAREDEQANSMANHICLTSLAFSVLCALICWLVSPGLVKWLGAEGSIYKYGLTYIRIVVLDLPFLFTINLFTSVRQSQGDTVKPMLLNMFGVVINLILDPLFLMVFKWGIGGAALATLIAKIPCAVIALIVLTRPEQLIRIDFRGFKFDKSKMGSIVKIGLPTAIGGSTMQLGFLLMTKNVNAYGFIATSAYGIGNKINSIITMPANGIGSAISTIVGQNIGAGQKDRADKAYHYALRMGALFLLFFGLILSRRFISQACFHLAQPCVFVKQLPGPILCASPYDEDPLSRSYRVNLPSSLTVNHSSASVFSTRPRVSVYGTGAAWISLADFLGSMVTSILRCASAPYTLRFDSPRGFAYGNQYLHPSTGYSVSRQDCHFSVSTSLHEAVWEY